MARELEKVYEPQAVESRIYDMWQRGGYFHAERDENKKPFTMGGGTYARHFPYAVSFGPEHTDIELPEFAGPMHGANEAAPLNKLLEAVKIYILALLRLEEIDF